MKKIHALFYDPAPNESDPEGYEGMLCDNVDRYGDIEGTHNWESVTCKRCLRQIEKDKRKQNESKRSTSY